MGVVEVTGERLSVLALELCRTSDEDSHQQRERVRLPVWGASLCHRKWSNGYDKMMLILADACTSGMFKVLSI